MSTLVKSLKRLYEKGSVTKERIGEMVEKGTVTEDEFKYITGEDYTA